LLYGNPKVGKSAAIASLEGCLLIDTEDNSDHLSGLKVKVKDLAELFEVFKEIKAKPNAYKFVALDTITKVEDWCEAHATNTYRNLPIGKNFTPGASVLTLPNGGGYYYLRNSLKRVLDAFFDCHPYTIVIGHTKDQYITTADAPVGKELDLTGKCAGIVLRMTSCNGYLYQSKDNVLRVNFSSSINNGSHIKRLAGKDIVFDWKEIYPV
jgi:hypothetical protein